MSFPDIPGYVTLKCEFHMHTVFSDGTVWPSIRVEEAWREGYDAIAITDHLEYQPHRQDMILTNHNRPYELARGAARSLDVLLVRAAESTRGEPPGHWNLLFLTDANAIPTEDHRGALRAAREQGAFVFWNHPGWKQPNRQSLPAHKTVRVDVRRTGTDLEAGPWWSCHIGFRTCVRHQVRGCR